jgi:WD40 repeat protein
VPGHALWIKSVALAPSKNRVVTASDDRTMKVWDVVSGAVVRTIEAGTCELRLVRFVDEENVLTTCADGTIRRWNLATGEETRSVRAHRSAFLFVVSRDGRRALTANLDGSERDAAGRQELRLWDLERLEQERAGIPVRADVAHASWSSDGRQALIATYRAEDGVELIDLASGKVARRFEAKSENAVSYVSFAATDRRAIIVHPGGPTLVFDVANGAIVERVEEELRLTVLPDGRLLSTTEKTFGTRELGRLKQEALLGPCGCLGTSSLSRDGSALVVSCDGIRVLDLSGAGTTLHEFGSRPPSQWSTAISPDGLTVAISRSEQRGDPPTFVSNGIDLVSLESGAVTKTLRTGDALERYSERIRFTGDGTRLVDLVRTDTARPELRVWDIAAGRLKVSRTPSSFVMDFVSFPDGESILVKPVRGPLFRVELEHLTPTVTYDPGEFDAASWAIAPRGDRLAMGSFKGLVDVWDASAGTLLFSFEPPTDLGKLRVGALAFSPDGSLLAVGNGNCPECPIRIHDARSGKLLRSWPAAKRGITRLRFADDRRLVSAGEQREAAIWDVQTGARLATDTRHRGIIQDLLPVDDVVISTNSDTAVRLLPIPRIDDSVSKDQPAGSP